MNLPPDQPNLFFSSYSFFDIEAIPEALVFDEEKDCNDGERVICKGTSTRRELKRLPNRTGYKARKEFWK